MRFRDLKRQYSALQEETDRAVQGVLSGGMFIMGEHVAKLEAELAAYAGVKHCVSCANGTDALTLALMAWDIGRGDAVFVPSFTFFSTAEAAAFLGATPVFYDVDAETFNADPRSLEETITKTLSRTELIPRAVVTVDLFGQPADYFRLKATAQKYGMKLLEDAAQGFGGAIDGRRACALGDISITSFYPTKPLGCYGDGGAAFTDDGGAAEKLRMLRVHGANPHDKYDNRLIGMNSRLDALQAAVLSVKFKAFQAYELEAVNRAAKAYDERLCGSVEIPAVKEGYLSSWAQYTIKLAHAQQRDALKEYLGKQDIPSMIFYPKPLHRQAAFAGSGENLVDLTVSETLSEKVLSLPMHPYLSEDEISAVCAAIRGFASRSI
jgi:dTDP-4-amino-4,6-dideoxygalactose transaminase